MTSLVFFNHLSRNLQQFRGRKHLLILKPPAQCSEEEIKKKPPETVRLVKHHMQYKGRKHYAPTHTNTARDFGLA